MNLQTKKIWHLIIQFFEEPNSIILVSAADPDPLGSAAFSGSDLPLLETSKTTKIRQYFSQYYQININELELLKVV